MDLLTVRPTSLSTSTRWWHLHHARSRLLGAAPSGGRTTSSSSPVLASMECTVLTGRKETSFSTRSVTSSATKLVTTQNATTVRPCLLSLRFTGGRIAMLTMETAGSKSTPLTGLAAIKRHPSSPSRTLARLKYLCSLREGMMSAR